MLQLLASRRHRGPLRLLGRAGLVALGLALLACAASERFYVGGIQVNEPDHERWVETLEASGLDTVAVTVYAHQGDWDSANLWYDDEDPAVISEVRAAKKAGLGAVLVLRVALDHAFERNKFLWHGMILPKDDALLDEWFARYRRFVAKWAKIAEREGIDVLAIGSEMSALTSTVPIDGLPDLEAWFLDPIKQAEEKERLIAHAETIEERHLFIRGQESFPSLDRFLDTRMEANRRWAEQVSFVDREDRVDAINRRRARLEEKWIEVIATAREHYSGPLSYAANFDQYPFVGFWDRLDLMSINAYFPLRAAWRDFDDPNELLPELIDGWRGVLAGILDFEAENGLAGMPVLLTELGYTFRANSTLQPWAGTGLSLVPDQQGETRMLVWQDQPIDPRERALALRALRLAHDELEEPLLAGILYWKLSTLPGHREVEPFVVIVGEEEEDPAVAELRRFARR